MGNSITIDNSPEINRFKEHLSLNNNEHIIFSGIFGIGKTTFLTDFFDLSQDRYELFKISPVNYSIAQTDDIIDYIKYDIAFELIVKKESIFEKMDLPLSLSAQFYALNNLLDIAALVVKNIGKTGVAVGTALETIKKLYEDAKKHNSESRIDEEKDLIEWLKTITNKNGSIFEENAITQIISSTIESIINESKKEVVLVIDDVDRLDPEHIFRILNVFACHFESNGGNKNKFGFDKIILVCDIENIRGIYHSKYGQNVDFSGYIDKFYSYEIFYFNNTYAVNKIIDFLINSIVINQSLKTKFNIYSSSFAKSLFSEIINDLLVHNLLNLRVIFKLYRKEFNPIKYKFRVGNKELNYWDFTMNIIFDLLVSIYGSISCLTSAIDKLAEKASPKLSVEKYYSLIIKLVDYRNHKLGNGEHQYIDEEQDIAIYYDIVNNSTDSIYLNIKSIKFHNDHIRDNNDFPFAILLKKAFDEYKGILKLNSN